MWTFRLVGGESLAMRVGLASVEHSGGLSLWSVFLTQEEAATLETVLVSRGIRVARWAEGPSEEQIKERDALMKAQRGEAEYLTASCPSCFWLDLKAEEAGLCGLQGWHDTTRTEALRMYERARKDACDCPLINREDAG